MRISSIVSVIVLLGGAALAQRNEPTQIGSHVGDDDTPVSSEGSPAASDWASRPVPVGLPAQVSAGRIRWRTGAVPTRARIPKQIRETITALAAGTGRNTNRHGPRHCAVQFDRPVTAVRRADLQAAGLTLLSYLGDNAFFASIAPHRLDAAAVARTPSLIDVRPVERAHKLHPFLAAGRTPTWAVVAPAQDTVGRGPVTFGVYILFHRDVPLVPDGVAIAIRHGAVIRSQLHTVNGLVVELSADDVPALADEDIVQWIEPALPRMSAVNDSVRAITGANVVQAPPYNLDGSGVTVLVYDGATADASHSDFGGRLTVRDESVSLHPHPTHVACIIGGNGADSAGQYRGMAPGVTLESYGFEWSRSFAEILFFTDPGDIEADYDEAINVFDADIANNSIGANVCRNFLDCTIYGDYGVTAAVIDAIVGGSLGSPFRVVWAAGNDRDCGIVRWCCDLVEYGYGTIPPPASAKNHISVGALNSNDDSVTYFTSWGPTDDGRIKPDLSAPGCQSDEDMGVTSCEVGGGYFAACGTSMATPTVTGLGALLLQDFRARFPGEPDFRNSTLKALLAHNAEDIGNPGPDYQTGYGSVRIRPTIDFMRSGNFFEAEVDQGDHHSILLVVSEGDPQLKVTLAWDDVPGTPNVELALVNDLDLRVYDPAGTQRFCWTLDPDQPEASAAKTGGDHINNIEQVVVDDPTPGVWRIEVYGFNVPAGPQSFSLCGSPRITDDCDGDGTPDDVQIQADPSVDCTGDGILDTCEPDCNANGQADSCDILQGFSADCDESGVPDECEPFRDCNGNATHDPCDIRDRVSVDCNVNWIPDECISQESDCNGNGVPDECEADCNANGIPDACDIADGTSTDCQPNDVPDECEADCNRNGVADACDIAVGTSADSDGNGIADECEVPVLYVDATATGLRHGTSWANAYTDLQDALTVASNAPNAATEIWVAEGTYRPAEPAGDPSVAFHLTSGVSIYGGFVGGQTSLAERDPAANVTILSGDLNGDDAPDFANREDNAWHVVMAMYVDATAVIDGFSIVGGYSRPEVCEPIYSTGAGMYIEDGNPVVKNCVFSDNFALTAGGGMYIEVGSPTLLNCVFIDNHSGRGGGLASAWLGSWFGGGKGGGMPFGPGGDPILINCTFIGNGLPASVGVGYGGGMWIVGGSPTLINCLFSGNLGQVGGGIYNWGSTPELINCTVSGHSGVGIRDVFEAKSTLTNCILWGNNNDGDTGETAQISGDPPIINYSRVQGWTGVLGGVGNTGDDPLFVDAEGPDNQSGTADDNLRLSLGSTCIDAGDNTVLPHWLVTDLHGGARFVDAVSAPDTGNGEPPIVDIGAYEFRSTDCNHNGIVDAKDIAAGSSDDCNGNGVPDECEPDCNSNGVADGCDIASGDDCNGNRRPDGCDIAQGVSDDSLPSGGDGIPDECQADCNANGTPDAQDIVEFTSQDCNGNAVPDECDIADGVSDDCGGEGIPDECAGCVADCECDDGVFCNGIQSCGPSGECQSGLAPCLPGETCDEAADVCVCGENADCDDTDQCTFDRCVGNLCGHIDALFGDVGGQKGACGPDGTVDLSDILAVLDGFQGVFAPGCEVPNVDIASQPDACSGDGTIDLRDILAVLDAFRGTTTCCPRKR